MNATSPQQGVAADTCATGPPAAVELRCVRPSLLDLRIRADAWILDQGDGMLSLRLGDYSMTRIPGLPWDLTSLNQLYSRVRHGAPRG